VSETWSPRRNTSRYSSCSTHPAQTSTSVPSKTDDKRIEVETQEFKQTPMPDKGDLVKTWTSIASWPP
jgi:hypothetical protein